MARIIYKNVDKEFEKVIKFFVNEIVKIRTGRANPGLVADIKVSAYESQMPLAQLANITVSDANLIVIQPWDKSLFDSIIKAIRDSGSGFNPQREGEVIKIVLPPLTQERREEYVKILRQKTEEARISIRQVRKDVIIDLENRKDSGNISEDDFKRYEKELQDKVNRANDEIESISKKKEEELMSI